MNILAVRITNFRSIVDSKWIRLSPDGITAFVGQNESGKSSILEAIYKALSHSLPSEDDFRINAPLPHVQIRTQISLEEILEEFDSEDLAVSDGEKAAIQSYLQTTNSVVELDISWNPDVTKNGQKTLEKTFKVNAPALDQALLAIVNTPSTGSESEQVATSEDAEPVTTQSVADMVWNALPYAILFNEQSGQLPSQVDIDEKGNPTGQGAVAAQNFLNIAGIRLPDLLVADRRSRENALNRANSVVSGDFNTFWTQTIGHSGRLALKCELDHYPASVGPEKAGKPHLVFWICDGHTQLYPKQRSQGVRWFVSFYLQLKSSEKNQLKRVFLLDEPGANLHSKAQSDVLRLINKLAKDISTVIYTTHSPQLLEYPKLYRVHAVQRNGDQDDSPSMVIEAHQLGTASSDTLSPVLSAMGADLSSQQVIQKTNNVLLEEMSGYYYMNSFWKLTSQDKTAHFIAATGVNKIQALANMFVGWGLDFIVAVDDDKQGREAFKSIKHEIFGDDESLASKRLIKLPECPSIEDVFSTSDFKKFVLGDESAKVEGTNGEYLKASGRSKPVLAFQFALAVENKKFEWANFDKLTQKKISAVVDAVASKLA